MLFYFVGLKLINMNKKILIVEDDPDFRDILQTGFKAEPSFSVSVSDNGEDGLASALEKKPDLIVLDILMPKMDGVEAARKIREKGVSSPIIFLTNLSEPADIDRAFAVNNARYVVKASMHIDEIVKTAKDILQN